MSIEKIQAQAGCSVLLLDTLLLRHKNLDTFKIQKKNPQQVVSGFDLVFFRQVLTGIQTRVVRVSYLCKTSRQQDLLGSIFPFSSSALCQELSEEFVSQWVSYAFSDWTGDLHLPKGHLKSFRVGFYVTGSLLLLTLIFMFSDIVLHCKGAGWKGMMRNLLYLPQPGNVGLGNAFSACGTVGGAVCYTLETCSFKKLETQKCH